MLFDRGSLGPSIYVMAAIALHAKANAVLSFMVWVALSERLKMMELSIKIALQASITALLAIGLLLALCC
jgi:hypothetical protein